MTHHNPAPHEVPTSDHYKPRTLRDRIETALTGIAIVAFCLAGLLTGCAPAPRPVVACNEEGTFCLSGIVEVTP